MIEIDSVSSKKPKVDTRNNWITLLFVCKHRYNCFLKQSHIDTCTSAFMEFKQLGFGFDKVGFGGNHVQFLVDIPKQYSMMNAEIMLKSRSAKRMFEKHPGFRKRYPRGSFWSGYEHHRGFGADEAQAINYIENQAKHHNTEVIQDVQAV